MRWLAASLIALTVVTPAQAETSPPDIFIGTLSVEGDEVILKRCDLVTNTYVLRDDPVEDGDAVAQFKALGKAAYGEVYGRYVEEAAGRNGLIVADIDNVTPGRDCHFVSMINAVVKAPTGPALWIGDEPFNGTEIATVTLDFSELGFPVLDIALAEGAVERLAHMTRKMTGRELEFKLGDRMIQRALLTEPITEGRLRIGGRQSVAEIKQLMRDIYCTLSLPKTAAPGLSRKERRCPSK